MSSMGSLRARRRVHATKTRRARSSILYLLQGLPNRWPLKKPFPSGLDKRDGLLEKIR
jgi:hypothetical protein